MDNNKTSKEKALTTLRESAAPGIERRRMQIVKLLKAREHYGLEKWEEAHLTNAVDWLECAIKAVDLVLAGNGRRRVTNR